MPYDPLAEASQMLRDAAAFIDAQGDLMAALRLGGRTPEKALRTLDRLHGLRSRMATEWLRLDALAINLAAPPPEAARLDVARLTQALVRFQFGGLALGTALYAATPADIAESLARLYEEAAR